ncbi:MAG: hypothetical protein GTO55_06105 [Armatimonadetes bacterium]|nr:hypothetical protein [Armatimonadota bacterium]NIM23826.1 hypothetical protein [Armatimonadota bacterium]NIM67705.1 hypothetical protein [Armatimonadota bacterium]NIM76214.1 hypothetical protein [Armatimonadota bacterium]NIN05907.1 hypothetical protein [Armatimonadota bacterium]
MRNWQTALIAGLVISLLAILALPGSAKVLTTSSFPLEGENVARAETTLGNLVADSLRDSAKADIALVNASQMRPKDLPAGPITTEQISSVLAYPDENVARVKMKGGKIIACLERGLSLLPKPNKGFLQVSGISVKLDSRRDSGSRVVEVKVGRERLAPDKEYEVALPLSLAKGAGGYFTILNGLEVKKFETTLLDTVIDYLSANGTSSAKSESPRLEDLKPPSD